MHATKPYFHWKKNTIPVSFRFRTDLILTPKLLKAIFAKIANLFKKYFNHKLLSLWLDFFNKTARSNQIKAEFVHKTCRFLNHPDREVRFHKNSSGICSYYILWFRLPDCSLRYQIPRGTKIISLPASIFLAQYI